MSEEGKIEDAAYEQGQEIPEVLLKVLLYCIEDAKKRLGPGEDLVPFTALAVKETLFSEDQEASSPEECYEKAMRTVSNARGATAYGFCYDGYINTDAGYVDALIAEGGLPGDEHGYAIGLIYSFDTHKNREYSDTANFVGIVDNFMADLKDEPKETVAEDAAETSEEAPVEAE